MVKAAEVREVVEMVAVARVAAGKAAGKGAAGTAAEAKAEAREAAREAVRVVAVAWEEEGKVLGQKAADLVVAMMAALMAAAARVDMTVVVVQAGWVAVAMV